MASGAPDNVELSTIDENCSICQESINGSAQIRKINHCRHLFHDSCIKNWLNQHVHCPVCRHDIREID